jgi:Yip1 domain
MLDTLLKPITSPVAFFRTLKDDDRVVSRAFLVVLIVAVLGGIFGYFSALPSADAMRGTPFGGTFSLVIAPVSTLFASIIFWLLYGLLVRMTAGMEAKPWAVVGYAVAPQILIYAVLIIIGALFSPKLTPISASLSDPQAFRDATFALQREFQGTLFGRASTLLGYASSLWWLFLIFIGVRETAGQPKAIRATVVIAVLTLAFLIVPFLLSPVSP